jgi:Mg-chelatase subunit ChlD
MEVHMSGLTPEEEQILNTLQNKKDAATGNKLIHVINVLDKSGSMTTGIDITIAAFNENLDVMASKSQGARVTASLITFSTNVHVEYTQASPDRAQRLNRENYVPDDFTALYDAIGRAIELAQGFEGAKTNAQFLLQIFTDGDENRSRIYRDPSKLKSMIQELNSTGRWTVTVMGPKGSLDLFTSRMGIYAGNTVQFDQGSLKSRSAARSVMNASTEAYFTASAAGATSMDSAYSSVVQGNDVDNA